MANVSGVLYTGVTNYLERRVADHKQKLRDGFANKYDVTRLVYVGERRRAELGVVIPVGQAEAHPWLGLFDTNGNVRTCMGVDGREDGWNSAAKEAKQSQRSANFRMAPG